MRRVSHRWVTHWPKMTTYKCMRESSVTSVIFQPFATLWNVACQAPLSMGFSRQEYWSGLSCPSPGDLTNQEIKPGSPATPSLQADSLPSELADIAICPCGDCMQNWSPVENCCSRHWWGSEFWKECEMIITRSAPLMLITYTIIILKINTIIILPWSRKLPHVRNYIMFHFW